jgi:hypothetical protein
MRSLFLEILDRLAWKVPALLAVIHLLALRATPKLAIPAMGAQHARSAPIALYLFFRGFHHRGQPFELNIVLIPSRDVNAARLAEKPAYRDCISHASVSFFGRNA